MAARSSYAFWIFIVFVLIAHYTVHLALGLGTNAPDLLTVALLLSVRRVRGSSAAMLGLGFGVLNDALAGTAFGAEAVVMTALGYIGARSRDLFEGDSLLFVGVYLFLGKWLHDVAYYTLAKELAHGDLVSRLVVQAPVAGVYAAAGGIGALLIYRASTGER